LTKDCRCLVFLGLVFLGVAGFLSLSAAQQTGSVQLKPAALTAADKRFVKEAAEGGMAEVELGRLAELKGSSDDVRKFGQRMVEDHSKANDKLKEVAAAKSIALPEKPNPQQEATKDRLMKLSGADFDKAYITDMVQDHKKDVVAFRVESRAGRDPDVKNFAATTLPTLRDHLKNAERIAPRVLQARGAVEPAKNSER
jgi:putative membrane protein